jgi:hypothetical protein
VNVGVAEAIKEFESRGGRLLFEGADVSVTYPREQKDEIQAVVRTLRANRDRVIEMVRERQGVPAPSKCPPLPPGVRLVSYRPKAPPVALALVSIVNDVDRFILAYLGDLRWRLAHPNTHACAPLREILTKLAEVGVELAIDGD